MHYTIYNPVPLFICLDKLLHIHKWDLARLLFDNTCFGWTNLIPDKPVWYGINLHEGTTPEDETCVMQPSSEPRFAKELINFFVTRVIMNRGLGIMADEACIGVRLVDPKERKAIIHVMNPADKVLVPAGFDENHIVVLDSYKRKSQIGLEAMHKSQVLQWTEELDEVDGEKYFTEAQKKKLEVVK